MAGRKEKQQDDFAFVTEKIVIQSNRRRWFKKIFGALLLAMIFGAAAGVSFAIVLPLAQARLPKKEEPIESITIPRDELPATESYQEPATTPVPVETASETETTEDLENLVQSILAEQSLTLDDYAAMYAELYQVVQNVNAAIVTVTSAESELDWFNNTYESEVITSGLVFNKTAAEVLILTDVASIHSADNIHITFLNGMECKAELRMTDKIAGIAVLAVDASQMEEEQLKKITVAVLGNSYTVKQGDLAIAVGNPFGYNYSMSYGIVSSIKNVAQAIDINYRLINTNILESSVGAGFLINIKGEITGIITKEYKNETSENIVTAIAVSDLKGTLERLSNGQPVAYLGIKGQDVTAEVAAETGLPQGIFVMEAVLSSPIYSAGIQSGDVIVAFDETELRSMKALRNLLESCQAGDTVKVTVMRKSREEYKTIEFEVLLGVQ